MTSTLKLVTDDSILRRRDDPVSLATLYSKLLRRSRAFDVLVCGFAPFVNGGGWFSAGNQEDLAARAHISEETFARCREILIHLGIVEQAPKKRGGGRFAENLYRINPAYLAAVLQARDLLAPRREDRP